MELNERESGDVTVLELEGRFDAYAAPGVADWLSDAAENPPANLVVDLARVTFVDSTACAVLVRGMKRCREQQGDLKLCSLQRSVRMIFELTRLDRAFEILPNADAAVAAYSVGAH